MRSTEDAVAVYALLLLLLLFVLWLVKTYRVCKWEQELELQTSILTNIIIQELGTTPGNLPPVLVQELFKRVSVQVGGSGRRAALGGGRKHCTVTHVAKSISS